MQRAKNAVREICSTNRVPLRHANSHSAGETLMVSMPIAFPKNQKHYPDTIDVYSNRRPR